MPPFSFGVFMTERNEKEPVQGVLRDRSTIKMVAEHWRCSGSHVRNMIDSGTLGALRLGKMIRITREQVAACEGACDTKAKLDQEKARVASFQREQQFKRTMETVRRQIARDKDWKKP